jgi:PAS domain S-box-containing protein
VAQTRRHAAVDADVAEAQRHLDRFLLWAALAGLTFGSFEIVCSARFGVWRLGAAGFVATAFTPVAVFGRVALARGRPEVAVWCACGWLLVGATAVTALVPEIDAIAPVAVIVVLVALPLVRGRAVSALLAGVLVWTIGLAALRVSRPPTPGIPAWFDDAFGVAVLGVTTALALFLLRNFHRRLIDLLGITRSAETRYRTLVEQLPAVTFIDEVLEADASMIRPIYISPQVESMLGYPKERWLVMPSVWREILHPDDRERALELADRVYAAREPFTTEYRLIAADGRIVWIEEASVIIPGSNGEPSLWQGVLFDVTARRVAEEESNRSLALLHRAHGQRRELLAAVVSAQEAERRRLATEIHDDPVQKMTAVGLRLGMLRRTMTDPMQIGVVEQIQATVELSIARLRALMFELRPPALDRGGLVAAVRDLAIEMDGTFPAWRIDDQLGTEPPEEIRTAAYRITVEALVNVQRHARASEVQVLFAERDGGLFVRVRDDGVGIAAETLADVRPGHLGLTSIRERAEAVGGWSRIEGQPSAGTIVEAWLPIAHERSSRSA